MRHKAKADPPEAVSKFESPATVLGRSERLPGCIVVCAPFGAAALRLASPAGVGLEQRPKADPEWQSENQPMAICYRCGGRKHRKRNGRKYCPTTGYIASGQFLDRSGRSLGPVSTRPINPNHVTLTPDSWKTINAEPAPPICVDAGRLRRDRWFRVRSDRHRRPSRGGLPHDLSAWQRWRHGGFSHSLQGIKRRLPAQYSTTVLLLCAAAILWI